MKILTFDIEDWFHLLDFEETKSESSWSKYESRIEQNLDRILELLDHHQQKATFFCLGWVGRKYPHLVKKIDQLGHEVGCHSDAHQLVYELSPRVFREDTHKAISVLEDLTSKKVVSYRAPGFSVTPETPWFFEVLLENGIERDSSIFPAKRAHGGHNQLTLARPYQIHTPSGTIREFPINVKNLMGKKIVYAGGGYFRLFPYSLIKRFSKETDYVMTYFHPRDFDPDQPVLQGLSKTRRFKSYYGLGTSFGKLDSFIQDFDCIDLAHADQHIDWGRTETFGLAQAA